jgi:predicted DNA-binding protein (MmcQ/YjbR family)
MAKKQPTDALLKELRAFGLTYPGAHTKSPWPGHLDLAVNDKTFAYLSVEGEPLSISCKLPTTSPLALLMPFTTPTAYGLGKSGWVSAKFAGHVPDLAMLKAWLDESYRAQAPKKLVKELDARGISPTSSAGDSGPRRAKETAPAKKRAKAAPARKQGANAKAKKTGTTSKAAKKAKPKASARASASVAKSKRAKAVRA